MKAPLDRLTNWGGSVNFCHSWFTSSWETKLERCTLDTTRQVFQDSFSFSLAFCQSCNSSLNTFYDSNFMWVFRYPGRPRWSTRVNHEQNCCPVQLLGRQKRGTRTSCWSSLPWGQLRYSWFVVHRLNLCFKSDFPLSWTIKICYLWRMRTSPMVCLLA